MKVLLLQDPNTEIARRCFTLSQPIKKNSFITGCVTKSYLDIDRIRGIKKEAEPDLLKIPGVTGVGIGYKYVNGKKTDELAILIYVKDENSVTLTLPSQIKGVRTHIIPSGKFVLHSEEANNTNLREKGEEVDKQ
jgi:hypothetical protein